MANTVSLGDFFGESAKAPLDETPGQETPESGEDQSPRPSGSVGLGDFFAGVDSAATQGGEAGGFAGGEEFAPEDEGLIEGIFRDTVEGSIAPLLAAWNAGRVVLSDPAIGVLPAEQQEEAMSEAGRQSIKGAAFWGSALATGGVGRLALPVLWRMALAGGAGATTFEAIRRLPDLGDHTIEPGEYVRSVATMGAFGSLTGGVIAKAPGATKVTLNAANRVIDKIPGGAKVRDKLVEHGREMYSAFWDKFFTSGQEVLRKTGLKNVADQLIKTRDIATITGGRLVGGFHRNVSGLSTDEMELMGTLLDKVPWRKGVDAATKNDLRMTFWHGKDPARFDLVWNRTRNESRRLRMIGLAMQKAGVQVFDPDNDAFHVFALRDEYLPHRFVKPEIYRAGGQKRAEAVEAVINQKGLERDEAGAWVDAFADRLQSDIDDFVERRTISLGAAGFLRGRTLNLPGYETDVSKVLPQYYEHAARRLANHVMFGPIEPTQRAVARQMEMFEKGQMGQVPEEAGQLMLPLDATGKGLRPTKMVKLPDTPEERVQALINETNMEKRKADSIMRRYPRAFEQLQALPDNTLRRLSTNIIRRQLGAIETVPFGERALSKLAMGEVVTKLALGAIAQPSQALSGVMRTFYRKSVPNFAKAMSLDPDALDFATSSGAILKGLVRQSEDSLTGGGGEFLKQVLFTPLDMRSRVFGALQGRSFAQHVSKKLAVMARQYPEAIRPKHIQKEMVKLERKLVDLGLDTEAIVRRGGELTNKEMLQAGMRVSGDVNFWGDALSLPEFYRSPYGKFLTQFKSFGFQQSKLIKDQLVKPAMRGDWGPITRFALTMPLGGELIADVKAMARGRDPGERGEGDPVRRILENIASAAGFGIMYDGLEATRYGVSGSLGLMAGPILTDVAKAHVAVGDVFREGDTTKLARLGLEWGLPFGTAVVAPGALPAVAAATPAISNLVLPKRESAK